jgi:Leucine-rich repeat (LRR) protein
LGGIRYLRANDDRVLDLSVSHLASLERLEELDLSRNPLTGAGLASLAKLPGLRSLRLAGAGLSNETLQPVGQFACLEYLDLSGTKVSDGCFEHLAALPSLVSLNLVDTSVTPQGVDRFRTGKPVNVFSPYWREP